MPLYVGTQRIAKLYKGGTPIARAYKGSVLVHEENEHPFLTHSGLFVASEVDFLSRTFGAGGNQKQWTLHWYIRRVTTVPSQALQQYTDGSNQAAVNIRNPGNDDSVRFFALTGGSLLANVYFNCQIPADGNFHRCMFVCDTPNATASDRLRFYVGGTRITGTIVAASFPSQNADLRIGLNAAHYIGENGVGSNPQDGYMAGIQYVQGYAPSDESAFYADGKPKAFAGSFGATGFRLTFANGGNLGLDTSGNGNHWTNTGVTQSAVHP